MRVNLTLKFNFQMKNLKKTGGNFWTPVVQGIFVTIIGAMIMTYLRLR